MIIGTRVMLARDVERFPHFIARAGSIGTIEEMASDYISVKMDAPLDDCTEWDNCIIWTADDAFESDVTPLNPAGSVYFLFAGTDSDGGFVYTAEHELDNHVKIVFPRGYFHNVASVPETILIGITI